MTMTLESYTSPQWVDAAKTAITAQVKFKELAAAVPFTASKNDPEQHGRAVFAAIAAGKTPIGAYPLASVQAAQTTTLRAACQAIITGGFSSSALGAPHTYPTQPADQTNLIAAATAASSAPAGWTVKLWCEDTTGAWAFVAHTAAQTRQVLADFVAAREAASAQLQTLTAQVTAAKTAKAVRAVMWKG